MAELNFGVLIAGFIVIVLGIALLVEVGDSVWESTNTFPVTAEVLDVTSARVDRADVNGSAFDVTQTFSLANDNIVSVSTVTHNNGTLLVENTDWDFRNRVSGTVFLYNSTTNIGWISEDGDNAYNQTNWTYTHGDLYVEGNASARTFIGLIPLFFVIGLLLIIIGKLFVNRFDLFNK